MYYSVINYRGQLIDRPSSEEHIGASVELVDLDKFGYLILFRLGQNKIGE